MVGVARAFSGRADEKEGRACQAIFLAIDVLPAAPARFVRFCNRNQATIDARAACCRKNRSIIYDLLGRRSGDEERRRSGMHRGLPALPINAAGIFVVSSSSSTLSSGRCFW